MRLSPHPAFHRLCYQAFNQSPIESCLDLRQLCGGTQVVNFGQLFSCYSQLFADALESGSVLAGQQWKIPSVEQHQIAVSLLAALLLWNLHVTHDIVWLQEPFTTDSALALLGRQQREPAIGIFQAVALWRMFPQIRKQGRINLQIIVYPFPSRRREAADGGADSDCGFILDKRNRVDRPVDTGHISHHLRSTETLLFAVRHSTALPDELTAGLRVQTVGQHCHDSAVDVPAVQTDTGSNPVVVLNAQHHFVKQADFL